MGTPLSSQNFFAGGMLITTMIGLRMISDFDRDPSLRKYLVATGWAKLALISSLTGLTASCPGGEVDA